MPTTTDAPSSDRDALDPKGFRRALGQFTTGVTVVTYTGPDGPTGATVNSFTSVSVDPPLVLVSIARSARSSAGLRGTAFTVNVLALEQLPWCLLFAGKPVEEPVPWVHGQHAPRLGGDLAWFECTPWAEYDGGDHLLFLGQVEAYHAGHGQPLVFHGGRFRTSGAVVLEGPRVLPLDGRKVPEWVAHAHRLHETSERGLDID